MRAAVCRAFGEPLTIENVTLRDPGPGEIEVRIEAVAVCHSDISLAEGGWGGDLPAVYGHEAAGRINALGAGVDGYAAGDSVLVTLLRSCGSCRSCQTAHPATCEAPPALEAVLQDERGTELIQGLQCGAFAEYAIVQPSQIARLREGMAMDAACLLACGVPTGLGAVINTGAVRAGEKVVVIGAGGVGLNAIQGARIAGASRIIAVDMVEEKLAAARQFGATDGILASAEKPWSAAKKITGRGADAVFVTVGASAAYNTANRYLAPGGRLVMVGMPHGEDRATYAPVGYAMAGQEMRGSMMGDTVLARDIPWMLDLYSQGRLMLDELISGRFDLDEINEAIANTKSGQARRNIIIL
jgi:S-(hydroxymethyl)mycothiol dehydrogenase